MVYLKSYQGDKKWVQAKALLNQGYTWIDVAWYYSFIGGNSVKIYAILDKERFLILGRKDKDTALLKNKQGEEVTADYSEVNNSRKIFEYS